VLLPASSGQRYRAKCGYGRRQGLTLGEAREENGGFRAR
jgi:hypothetical protein